MSIDFRVRHYFDPRSDESFVARQVGETPAPSPRPIEVKDVLSAPMIPVKFSFVIPVKDERDSIAELYSRIKDELERDEPFEVIFIDDGSRDGSWDVICALVAREAGRVRGLRFRRNAGKASALTAGFRAARGEIIFTLDADLQDDPKEIRRFLEKLSHGYDLVSGWKKVRHDPWHKVLPSRVFNRMLSLASGVRLHDHNCGFKCYRGEVAKGMTLYGELHRMVPALAGMDGYRVAEIEVEHHARKHGQSKYGFERYLRGFVDMMMIGFLRKYRDRPSHFISGIAATCAALGAGLIVAGAGLALFQVGLASVAAVAAGSAFLGTAVLGAFCALLAEIANRGGLQTGWSLPIIEDTANTPGYPHEAPLPRIDRRFGKTSAF